MIIFLVFDDYFMACMQTSISCVSRGKIVDVCRQATILRFFFGLFFFFFAIKIHNLHYIFFSSQGIPGEIGDAGSPGQQVIFS